MARRSHGRLAGTDGKEKPDLDTKPKGRLNLDESITLRCTTGKATQTNNGAAITMQHIPTTDLDRNRLIDLLVNARLRTTVTLMDDEGSTPSLLVTAFDGTADSHSVKVDSADGNTKLGFRLSYKCTVDEFKHLVDFGGGIVEVAMVKEGTAGDAEEDEAGEADNSDPNQMRIGEGDEDFDKAA